MTSLRSALVAALILAGFIPVAVAQAPVEWYTDSGGGGALAQPAGKSKNGGVVAPLTATGPVDLPESDISATEPISSPARAASEPSGAAEPHAPAAAKPPVGHASQDAPTVTGGDDQESTAAGPIAALPLTGLQLAAVAAAGLFLLAAGALLRPRRRPAAPR